MAAELTRADIVIAGGGPVGSVLAHALAPLAESGLAIVLARPDNGPAPDRPIALSHGSRLLLDRLQLWKGLPATPIRRIHVSQRQGFGRTLIDAADHGIDALGHVAGYRALVEATALDSQHASRISVRTARLDQWTRHADRIEATVGGERIESRLLVIADGGRQDDEDTRIKDYGQSAVVCEITPGRPHGNMAWERFTTMGPVALLPWGDRYALVWTSPHEEAERLRSLDEGSFLEALQSTFGLRAGRFIAAGARGIFPLSLRVHKARAQAGVIAIGNAAQTLHPVAGQGLNLGLRDAWELAEACGDAFMSPSAASRSDIGSAAFAKAFAARRRIDRDIMVRLTDGMIGAFSLDIPCSSAVRGAALAFLDAVPPARRLLSRRMMFGARAIP